MTDRLSTERLRQSEERFRLLVSSVKDYAIFLLDSDGRVASWNEGARALKGWEAEEIIGSHIQTFYPPEDREAGKPYRLLEIAARDGRVEDEGYRVRKDGTRFWADVVLTALRDDDGTLVGFAKVTRDLSVRKAAEEEMRRSEVRFRLMIESVRDYAIVMLDPGGKVASWNSGAERILGYGAGEIVGRHFSTFCPEEDVAAGSFQQELDLAVREGRFENEGWRVRKDGTRFWANVVVAAVRAPGSGELLGFSQVTRDLTERRRLEQEQVRRVQAEEAIRLRDEFLSIASHELKTPLTALRLQLQSLRQKVDALDERMVSRLERADHSSIRLVNLVEALLDVSRIASGRFELSPTPFDLAECARDVAENLGETAAQSAAAVGVSAPLEPVIGTWDRVRIEQVISNLVSNAIKYSPGQPVVITITRDGDGAVVVVRDRGPGIREEDCERIFERFERAVSMRHYGGMGLGLYVARQIVEAHGGTISAGNAPGGGAVFTVRLPMVVPAGAGAGQGARSEGLN